MTLGGGTPMKGSTVGFDCELSIRPLAAIAVLALATIVSAPGSALADEGGVSFWIPGFFGSLAATPQQPGWSLATIYYHTSVSAGSDVARAREITTGRMPINVSASLTASLDANADLGLAIPSYVFATPVLWGQASVSLIGIYGRSSVPSLTGTLAGVLATPFGTIPFTRSDNFSDSV